MIGTCPNAWHAVFERTKDYLVERSPFDLDAALDKIPIQARRQMLDAIERHEDRSGLAGRADRGNTPIPLDDLDLPADVKEGVATVLQGGDWPGPHDPPEPWETHDDDREDAR
jgi:hypothetical protein